MEGQQDSRAIPSQWNASKKLLCTKLTLAHATSYPNLLYAEKSPLMHRAEPLFGRKERHPDETKATNFVLCLGHGRSRPVSNARFSFLGWPSSQSSPVGALLQNKKVSSVAAWARVGSRGTF